MKIKIYVFALCVFSFLQIQAQDIDFLLGKCGRNAELGQKAFSLENLKYYAKLSKNALYKATEKDNFLSCEDAYILSESVSIHLESALVTDDFATAKSHLIKVSDIVKDIFHEYNICTSNNAEVQIAENTGNTEISDIEKQQQTLKKQQEKLALQEKMIEKKLEAQKEKVLQLKRQTFINKNEKALFKNIESYNATLESCNCQTKLNKPNFLNTLTSSKSIEEIRTIYLNKTLELTRHYAELLTKCKGK